MMKFEMMVYTSQVNGGSDPLETEYQALTAAVLRVEERLSGLEAEVTAVDQKLDRMALKSELVELKDQVALLTERIAQLEKALN